MVSEPLVSHQSEGKEPLLAVTLAFGYPSSFCVSRLLTRSIQRIPSRSGAQQLQNARFWASIVSLETSILSYQGGIWQVSCAYI